MKKLLLSSLLVGSLSVAAVTPVLANTSSTTGMQSNNVMNGNGYGTNAFDGNRAGTYGTYDRTRMNAFSGTRATTNNLRTNNYRAAATNNDRDFDWGWLGLLGLIGLAGMRSRSREDVR